ncbi:MAG TPA: lysoplasmalogenase family protein [Croceicoccus sp.]|nr:lysoplasmalogenase family protein [Croceicoccus sp.]
MVRRALIQRRPWLFASLLVAISWWAFGDSDYVPGLFKIVWKAAPLSLLAIYAFQRHLGSDGTILACVMGIAALADGVSELVYSAAGTLMGFSLLLAIWLYSRNRRKQLAMSQKGVAAALVLALPVISWFLLPAEDGRILVAGYALLMGIMAAMAWTSRFSRYRVGMGAMMFVVSELLLFAVSGPVLRANAWAEWLIYPIYYSGQLLIATGVVSRLRREAAA